MSMSSSSFRRPHSASGRTFIAPTDISSNLSRAKSIKNVKFDPEAEEHEDPVVKALREKNFDFSHIDPSIPKGRGEGLGLPDFLKKRAL